MLPLLCLFTLAEAVKFEVNYEAESQSPDSPLSVDGDALIGMTAEEMAELQALQAQAQADAEVDSAEIPVPLPVTRQNAYIGSPPASPRDTVTELPLDAQTVTDLPVELAATVTDLPFAATLTDLPVMQPRRTRRKPGKNNAMALASQAPEVPFDDLPLCHCKPPDMNDASQVLRHHAGSGGRLGPDQRSLLHVLAVFVREGPVRDVHGRRESHAVPV
jgi:hypothetical protein